MEQCRARRARRDWRQWRVIAGSITLALTALTIVPQIWTDAPIDAATVSVCTASALQVMVVFDGPENGNGAIFLQDVSSHECSLSGRPSLRVFNQKGHESIRPESLYRWTPLLPRPAAPIVLSPGSTSENSVSAVVEFDWCGFESGNKRFDIDFRGSKRPFVVRSLVEGPSESFKSPSCSKGSKIRLAVDYVREMGPRGIPGLPQTVRVAPSTNLRNGEKVRVSVSGFWPGGKFWLSECAGVQDTRADTGCGVQLAAEPFGLASYTGAGTFTFDVQSRAAIKPLSHATVVCKDQCVLVAVAGPGLIVYTPLAFAKS